MKIIKISPEDDFGPVSRIYALSWKAAYRGIVPQDYLDKLSNDNWSEKLKRQSGWTHLALEHNGELIGTSSVSNGRDEDKSDWGEIISIYLLPEYFGSGWGKELLAAAEDELKAKGYRFIYLWVLKDNPRARRFYEKNGYTATTDTFADNVGGKDLAVVRYIKML